MARRNLLRNLSGQERSLDQVWDWYQFQDELIGEENVRTLDFLSNGGTSTQPCYFARTPKELIELFDEQRNELEYVAMLNLLAATEAALRVDYLVRVSKNKKDAITKRLGSLHQKNEKQVGLRDILNCWKQDATPMEKEAIGRFSGAIHLRHWLAHGRYWEPRLEQAYDSQNLFPCGSTAHKPSRWLNLIPAWGRPDGS